jgi:hypothetical protein
MGVRLCGAGSLLQCEQRLDDWTGTPTVARDAYAIHNPNDRTEMRGHNLYAYGEARW